MKNLKILLLLWLFAACVNRQQMAIQPLKMLDTVTIHSFNGKTTMNKFVNYKVYGYKNNKESLKYIADFIKINKDTESGKYGTYLITLFKASDETNLISLKQHPDRYYNINTTICEYKWFDGKFVSRTIFDNGKIVEPKSNVVIKDLPVTKN